MEKDTYIARWEKDKKIIYKNEPFGNLFGALPRGAWPVKDEHFKKSWNNEKEFWNEARFITPSGRTIIVKKERSI